MLSQREVEEYGRLAELLQQEADRLSLGGDAALAGLLVLSRQALRVLLTKGLELQQVAQDTDAVLSAAA